MNGDRSRQRNRDQRSARQSKRRLLVVCGGKRTERDYIDALKRAFPLRATVTVRARGDSPRHCIEYAIGQCRDAEQAFDEVWCVFDVDQFKIDDELQRRAGEHSVALAVSNPCFELWLLLHLVDVGRPFTDCGEVRRTLTNANPRYDKSRLAFGHFRDGVDKAVDRARRLEERNDRGRLANPSTGVWRLVTRIVGET